MENCIPYHTGWHYEYFVMLYGLANAPSVFQLFFNKIFKDLISQYVVIYIDDIFIYLQQGWLDTNFSCFIPTSIPQPLVSADTNDKRIPVLFIFSCSGYNISTSLTTHYFIINKEKICAHTQTYIYTDIKIKVVTNWPTPTTIKELQRFLGFANF